MTAQEPAHGILLVNSWGTSKMYKAVCECGDDDCTHTIDVEADEPDDVEVDGPEDGRTEVKDKVSILEQAERLGAK
jgi:hypothetical protein